MSNVQRHRTGEGNCISYLSTTNTAYEVGDMLYSASDAALPAGTAIWNSNLAVTQEAFHDAFLGVSQSARLSQTATDNLLIATSGVHEMKCGDEVAKGIGTLMGPSKQSGNGLEPQQVSSVATANLSVGRLVKTKAANATTCLVEITGSLTRDGVQAVA